MGKTPCCDKNGLKKGPWTPEEDHKLTNYIQKYGSRNWRTLPGKAGLRRCGKSCRLRWTNYLRPDIKRGRFSFEEEVTIIQLHSILGNKWSVIAAHLPGRTDNEIKNYWNTRIRKRLPRMGIEPVTCSPRLDLLDLSSIINVSNSLYGTSHMNLSGLLGLQPLVNHELQGLANSLVVSQRENQCSTPQNCQENQLSDLQVPNQYPIVKDNHFQSQLVQEFPTSTWLAGATTPCFPFSDEAPQIMEPNSEQIQSSISNFCSQLSHDWENQTGMAPNVTEEYEPLTNYYDNNYYYPFVSDHEANILEQSSETSPLISNNNNFGFVCSSSSSMPNEFEATLHYNSSSTTSEEKASH